MDELSYSAYVVLGLIAQHGPMTPYELKARVEESIGFYWPIPHAQLYRDPPKLADLGLLVERAEDHGRRRRVFHLTDMGRATLEAWLADPKTAPPETRDPSLLKLTFADPDQIRTLAAAQADAHREWLDTYRATLADLDPDDPGAESRTRVLAIGVLHEESYVRFWSTLADGRQALADLVRDDHIE